MLISGTLLALLLGSLAATAIGGAVSAGTTAMNNKTQIDLQNQANSAAAAEAQKNRDWQEMMSNTAHQREVADLKAAGLNPWLSVSGSGAPVTSGSTATQQAAHTQSIGDAGLSNVASSLQSLAFMAALQAKTNTATKGVALAKLLK